MSEVSLVATDRQVITVSLDPNALQGRDMAGQPGLYLPLKLQLLPGGQKGEVQYTLLRLAGKVTSPSLGEFATFEVGPLAVLPNATPFYRQYEVTVVLDRQRAQRFEDARSGANAHLQLSLSHLLWYPAEQRFETNISSGYLDIIVPKSQWADNVVSVWNLSNVKVVEIHFPKSTTGENFRTSYTRVEEAEKMLANGQYKQVLTTLRLSFEALAMSLGYEKRVKESFEFLFASAHPDKKEKAREALTSIYKFLHLGPHEQANHPDPSAQPVVTRQDARFALTLAYAIFEYITPNA